MEREVRLTAERSVRTDWSSGDKQDRHQTEWGKAKNLTNSWSVVT